MLAKYTKLDCKGICLIYATMCVKTHPRELHDGNSMRANNKTVLNMFAQCIDM